MLLEIDRVHGVAAMVKRFAVIALLALGTGACATTQAKAPVERPSLDVPPVPARVVDPPALPPQPPIMEPVGDLPSVSPTSGKPRPQPQRDTAKPDPKVEAPPVEVPAAPPANPSQAPVPPLRTAATADSTEAVRQINEMKDRTIKILKGINKDQLPPERRTHFDNAWLFLTQADDAVKASNLDSAKKLAEKAELLAKELLSR